MTIGGDVTATHLGLPRPPETTTRRSRLARVLDDANRRPLTLLSAVPGAGKTTLLASWAQEAEATGPIAWRTVGGWDNETDRFADLLSGALFDLGGAEPRHGDGRGLDGLRAAVGAFERRRCKGTIVLDDVHELSARPALVCLEFLVERGPPWLDIVLATREDPPLRLGRFRAAGLVSELRTADLTFRRGEAGDLFRARGLDLNEHDVTALHRLTEGWAAGLALIAYSIERGASVAGVLERQGRDPLVFDYLLGEVLSRQPESIQDFLMRTSIVNRLTPELATLLTDNGDAAALLDLLERKGVFLSRLEAGDVYRYHALFAALLRSSLTAHDPALLRDLHRRTARWYATRGLHLDAEAHARAAGDEQLLGAVLHAQWMEELRSQGETNAERTVPGAAPTTSSSLLPVVGAARACARLDREAFTAWSSQIERPPEPGDALLIETLRGRAFGADAPALAAADALTTNPDPAVRDVATLARAELALDLGDLSSSRSSLAELAQSSTEGWARRAASSLLALTYALEGRLTAAESLLGYASDLAPVGALAQRLVDSQRGQHGGAAALEPTVVAAPLQARALRAVVAATTATFAVGAVVRLPAAGGDEPAARLAFVALGALDVVDDDGRHVPIGDEAEAAVRLARHRLEAHAFHAVLDTVAPVLGGEHRAMHPRTLIEAHVLATLAHVGSGGRQSTAEATAELVTATALAAEDRLWAPILDYGDGLSPILRTLSAEAGPAQADAVRMLDGLRRSEGWFFVGGLTHQEAAVLHYLPTLMSNAEIAEGMNLSVNTVKTHLKALYRKLGVDRRRDAVLRAHHLGLLP